MGQRLVLTSNRSRSYTRAASAQPTLRLKVDVPLLAIVITLLAIGILMVFSASWDFSLTNYGSHTYIFARQLQWLALGTLITIALVFVNYHWLSRFVVPMMLVTIAMLFVVLFINEVRHGATRTVSGGSYQPSELAKLVIILYLAVWLFAKKERLHDVNIGLLPLGMILGVVGG